MPTQVRRFIFTRNEVMIVLTNHFSSKGGNKTVIGLDISATEPIQCRARIQEDGKQFNCRIEEDELRIAMLEYCESMSIPVPRAARKGVHKSEHGLHFDIVIEEPTLIAKGATSTAM